jgi:hypothetical protein
MIKMASHNTSDNASEKTNGAHRANGAAIPAAMMNGTLPLMQYWMASNMELLRLAGIRASRDAQAISELMQCQSPEQFTAVWARLAGDAAGDYGDTMKRLMVIGSGDDHAG